MRDPGGGKVNLENKERERKGQRRVVVSRGGTREETNKMEVAARV